MAAPSVQVLPADRWADAVTDAAATLLASPSGVAQRWCLPTGATPKPLYARWAERLDLAGVDVFLLDEFVGLDADDPGRCAVMLRHDLIDRLPAARRPTVHDIDVDAPVEPAWPGPLHLAVLGLGANGHVGMNEPGTTLDAPTRRAELAESTAANTLNYGARRRPTGGVTVGLAPLMAADRIWVIVTGAAKAGIVAEALHGPATPHVPASLLRAHSDITWWLDEPAAAALDALGS